MSALRFPDTIRAFLAGRYRNQHAAWLAGGGNWPLRVSLGCPTEEQALAQSAAVTDWVREWRAWSGPGAVEWCERRWRSLGEQRLPERLAVASAEDIAAIAGEDRAWTRAVENYRRLCAQWPALAPRMARWFDALAAFEYRDVEVLETLLAWLEANPLSNYLSRQLPIPGMHTKWLEPRLPMVADLLGAIKGESGGEESWHARCGLKEAPSLIRLRILDCELRRRVGGIGDLSIPLGDLRALELPAERIFIVENLQTGLAFEEHKGTVVVMGLGYGVSMLAAVPWIVEADCVYWGDIDTHGFAILNRARACFRHVGSALMDEATLLKYRDLWGTESEQCPAADLPLLTDAERSVYRGLKEQRWGLNVRLEQERIAWNDATAHL